MADSIPSMKAARCLMVMCVAFMLAAFCATCIGVIAEENRRAEAGKPRCDCGCCAARPSDGR